MHRLRSWRAGAAYPVIDAVYDDLVDANCLESIHVLKVAWHLPCGSGRREGAWEAEQNYLFVLDALRERDLLWRKTVIEDELVRHLRANQRSKGEHRSERDQHLAESEDLC